MFHGDVWSEREIVVLTECYDSGIDLHLISKRLGRSYSAVSTKASRLGMKVCKSCSIEGCHEPVGKNSVYKICTKHYNICTRNYYLVNADKIRERVRVWRKKHRNRFLKNSREYYSKNRSKIIERAVLWNKKNPEKARMHIKQYKLNHVEEHRLSWQNYRARKRGAKGSHTLEEWLQIKNSTSGVCPCCNVFVGVLKLTKDHIMSLKLHGSNYVWNLQPLCLSCNSGKGKRVINYLEGWKAFHRSDFHKSRVGN